MSDDNFDSEVQRFVSRQNGGELTPKVVYDMLCAADRDAVRRHEESVSQQAGIMEMLESHCEEAVARDRRISDLEAWRTESQATCSAKVLALIEREHDERHSRHMETHHKDDDFRAKLIWFFATALGKVVLVVLGIAAGILLNMLVY